MIKIGFDFDGVLSDKLYYRILAKQLVQAHNSVYIITKRPNLPGYKEEVLFVARQLGIPVEKVYFTAAGPKSPVINKLGISLFYDDQIINKFEIEVNSKCKVILVTT
jgi:uncharacterized HAD superfamily protein